MMFRHFTDAEMAEHLIETVEMPDGWNNDRLITVSEFARLAMVSRDTIDRLRKQRPRGFPAELNLSASPFANHAAPRFRLSEVTAWLDSRETWGREPLI